MIKFYLLIILAGIFTSCKSTPEPFDKEGITTYGQAKEWVISNYQSETVTPTDSKIHKITYFKDGKFMLIYFNSKKSKGYLYHRVSRSLWTEFKNSDNKASFYRQRIKDNKTIYLKLKK